MVDEDMVICINYLIQTGDSSRGRTSFCYPGKDDEGWLNYENTLEVLPEPFIGQEELTSVIHWTVTLIVLPIYTSSYLSLLYFSFFLPFCVLNTSFSTYSMLSILYAQHAPVFFFGFLIFMKTSLVGLAKNTAKSNTLIGSTYAMKVNLIVL